EVAHTLVARVGNSGDTAAALLVTVRLEYEDADSADAGDAVGSERDPGPQACFQSVDRRADLGVAVVRVGRVRVVRRLESADIGPADLDAEPVGHPVAEERGPHEVVLVADVVGVERIGHAVPVVVVAAAVVDPRVPPAALEEASSDRAASIE